MANRPEQETQHALLVVWGKFAQEIGLIAGIEAVKIGQKNYEHPPQAKVLELFVAILAGAKHLHYRTSVLRHTPWTKTWQ